MTTSTRTKKTTTAPAAGTDEKTLYVGIAEGRGGKICRRKTGTIEMHFAVDCADPEAKSAAGKAGLTFSYHATEAQAQAAVERYNAKGLDAVIVPAIAEPIAS